MNRKGRGRSARRAALTALFAVAAALLLLTAAELLAEEERPLRVTATTGMIGDLATRIGGEYVTVKTLMGPGVDPHLYKAREKDIRALAYADVVFYNGLHLEGKLGDVLSRIAKKKRTVAVGEAIDPSRLLETSGGGAHDPHVWFDVSLWMVAAGAIRDGLVAADPAHREAYGQNAAALLSEMQALNDWTSEQIAEVPKGRRVLITAHDAFGYFGRAYDIEVRGIQGISTESEAGVRGVNELVDFIASRGVKAVFVESSVPRKNVESLIEGCRARGHDVVVGGELYSDAMGAAGTPEGTYLGAVRHNVSTIVAALK